MPEYTNAQSFAPTIGSKPDGILGSYLFSQRDRDYRDQLSMLQLMQEMKYKEEMAKRQEYEANAPLREKTRSAGMTTQDLLAAENMSKMDPSFIGAQRRGDIGKALEQEMKGRVASETAQGDIDSGNAANEQKQRASFLASALQQLQAVQGMPPGMKNMAWAQVLASAPANMRDKLPQQYTPGIEEGIKTALRDTAAHMQKMAQDRQAQASTERVHAADQASRSDTARYVADTSAEAKMAMAQQNDNQRKTAIRNKLARGAELTPDEQADASRDIQAEVNKSPVLAPMAKALEFLMITGDKSAEDVQKAIAKMDLVRGPEFDRLSGGRLPNPYKAKGSSFSAEQESWISRAQQTNPGMSREKIIEEGKKRGKL